MNRFLRRNIRQLGMKALVLAVALSVSLTCAVGGTLAWLVDDTKTITNTFTYGDINIDLDETDTNLDGDNDPLTNSYEMTPGAEITKDPTITVKANSKDSWLFVKVETTENFGDFLTYEMADGWIALNGVPGVYYRETTSSDEDQVYAVLKDNKVCVKNEVTKEMLNALDTNNEYPVMKITAYAVQRDAELEDIDTAAEAWLLTIPSEDAAL